MSAFHQMTTNLYLSIDNLCAQIVTMYQEFTQQESSQTPQLSSSGKHC